VTKPLRIITQPEFPNDAPVKEGSIIHLEFEAVSEMPSIYYQVCFSITIMDLFIHNQIKFVSEVKYSIFEGLIGFTTVANESTILSGIGSRVIL